VTHDIDDQTLAYVVASQPVFEDLRQVAAQLAGMLVLSATGAKSAAPDHPMLVIASRLFTEASERVEHVRPSVTARAQTHHAALTRATSFLRDSLAAARVELGRPPASADLDAPLVPLRHAYDALQHAAASLPGFQMVAFDQGCCGGGDVRLKADATHVNVQS